MHRSRVARGYPDRAGTHALVPRDVLDVPLLGASQRVHWCGRDYDALPGPAMSWRQVAAHEPWPVRIVDLYPPVSASQEALFASISPAIVNGTAGQVASCATVLYTRLGPNRYQPYSLLGGP